MLGRIKNIFIKPKEEEEKMSEEKATQKQVTIDADKGMYTHEEVCSLLKDIGVKVIVKAKDGKAEEPKIEEQ
jgi:hypothetical protein